MFWQHSIFASVLLIFSMYDSTFSSIGVGFLSKLRVSSVSNCLKVIVFYCAESLGICLTFCNKGVSVWIGNWGISFGVLGVSVCTESSSILSDLVSSVGSISIWSTLLRYKESQLFGADLFTSTLRLISCDMESASAPLSIFAATVLDKKSKRWQRY